MKTPIEILHETYCERTGFEISLGYDRERAWHEFIKAGFTRDDLSLVICALIKAIHAPRNGRNPGCLRFRNLIERLNDFEEELAMAKAQMRNFKPKSSKENALEDLRGPENVVPMNARPAREVIERLTQEMRKAAQ
jgi:hypothetical protein